MLFEGNNSMEFQAFRAYPQLQMHLLGTYTMEQGMVPNIDVNKNLCNTIFHSSRHQQPPLAYGFFKNSKAVLKS
jgi:hypothetical protein